METKTTHKSSRKAKKKTKTTTKRSWSISLTERIKKINYFRTANMKEVLRKTDEHLRVRIRVIIWKQWKTIAKREKSLIQLGVERKPAHNIACTRKGYYQICKTRYVQFAINNDKLRQRGLIFLSDQYEKVHI